jgi:MFS family permease
MLGIGRFIFQLGIGFTLFYMTIFFVNQLGFSATSVGLALGSGSIAGIVGRLVASSLCDSSLGGRRRTLLLAATLCAIAAAILAATNSFSILVIGNLLMGFGQGLYWSTIDTAIADLISPSQCQDTFAVMRVMDYIGLGIGILLGGEIIGLTGAYRALFLCNAMGFVAFFVLIYTKVAETYQPQQSRGRIQGNWAAALSDRRLLVYAIANTILTIYASQFQAVLPLYWKNFAVADATIERGFSATTISILFGWHVLLAIVCQLPITRALKRLSPSQAMIFSATMWGLGFIAIWVMGIAPSVRLGWAILATEIFAIAAVSLTPAAVSIVNSLASPSQRSTYFTINSLCGSVGYIIGPPLGTWILDQSPQMADRYWLLLAASAVMTIGILQYLHRLLKLKQ